MLHRWDELYALGSIELTDVMHTLATQEPIQCGELVGEPRGALRSRPLLRSDRGIVPWLGSAGPDPEDDAPAG